MRDRHYSPPWLADRVAALASAPRDDGASGVVDCSCGNGSLLAAVAREQPQRHVFGLDADAATIRRLRRRQPNWVVSTADFLNTRSRTQTRVLRAGAQIDLLVANPPFSNDGGQRLVDSGNGIPPASTALAHLMLGLSLFPRVRTAVAVLPHSAMFSEQDVDARAWLSERFEIDFSEVLRNTAFPGVRANTAVVRYRAKHNQTAKEQKRSPHVGQQNLLKATLVRGGLPVHQAGFVPQDGTPFLHSTSIRGDFHSDALPQVNPLSRGLVAGWVLLIPRVTSSSPKPQLVFLPRPCQLSDCVLAVVFKSERAAQRGLSLIANDSSALRTAYGGTGARYTTVRRLTTHLWELGIQATTARNAGFPGEITTLKSVSAA